MEVNPSRPWGTLFTPLSLKNRLIPNSLWVRLVSVYWSDGPPGEGAKCGARNCMRLLASSTLAM